MSEIKKDQYTAGAWRHVSHEKDRPKPAVSLAQREKEARALELSFGTYMGYLESGYLETYKRDFARRKLHEALSKEKKTVIVSHIGGGGIAHGYY